MTNIKQEGYRKAPSHWTLALLIGSSLFASAVDARTLNYTTPAPPTDRPTNEAMRWWADEVEKRTDGSLEIKIHWLQSLVKFKDALRGIQSGVADMGPISPDYTREHHPLLALNQTEVGSGDNYIAVEAWLRATEDSEALKKELENLGVKPIGYYSSGVRVNMSTTRPYLTPDDFNGDKVRLTPRTVSAASINDWDVTPVNMTFTDIYSSMERGTLDGSQSYLYLVLPYKHHEVADYVVETGIGQSMLPIMMNLNTWNSLSEKEQAVLNELTPELSERLTRAGLEEAESARDTMKNGTEYPVEYHLLNEDQRNVWEEQYAPAVEEYIAELAERNSAAPELNEKFMEELDRVEKEVQEKGYPWERD